MNKKDRLKELILDLHRYEGNQEKYEEIRKSFQEEFGTISSLEISKIEQELLQEGLQVEDIQRLCNIHASVFQGAIEDIHSLDSLYQHPGHPLLVFTKENEGLMKVIKEKFDPSLRAYESTKTEEDKLDLLAVVKDLSKIIRHYERKENLLFPFLEKAGITGPSKVMWGKDDEVRALFKDILSQENKEIVLLSKKLREELVSMITKENDILAPMLIKNIDSAGWLLIGEASPTIGYAFNGGIEGASPSDAVNWVENNKGEFSIIEKEVDEEAEANFIKMPSGNIALEDLVHMLNTLPVDLTFIDKDDNVRYFTEGKDPVFARTRTIIGRDVRNCHPPKAQQVLNQLLSDFKNGIKDEEIRTLKLGTKVLLIRYYAVRDKEANYIGTLEVTEEISKYRQYLN